MNALTECVVVHAREIMQHWTGTNCTYVDDDITALGILAGQAIAAGLYRDAAIPQSMKDCIEAHIAKAIETREGQDPQGLGAEHESAVPKAFAQGEVA